MYRGIRVRIITQCSVMLIRFILADLYGPYVYTCYASTYEYYIMILCRRVKIAGLRPPMEQGWPTGLSQDKFESTISHFLEFLNCFQKTFVNLGIFVNPTNIKIRFTKRQ